MAALTLFFSACLAHDALNSPIPAETRSVPLGLPPLPVPPADPAVIALGKKIFFDRRLSFNNTMSCGMCHVENDAFTSHELGSSVGMEGQSLRRNAPSLFNVVYQKTLFWDGREDRLETQIWSPIMASNEMAAPSVGWVLDKIEELPGYLGEFEEVFPGRGVTMDTVGEAVAAYERSLLLGNSRFDQWHYGGVEDALTPQEKKGFELFTGKANCAVCHQLGPQYSLFTDDLFHDTGLAYANTMGIRAPRYKVRLAPDNYTHRTEEELAMISDPIPNDVGRFEVTQVSKDRWAYKTPSLRNVELTFPYMHTGVFGTLEEVVDYYNRGGDYSANKSELVKPLGLSADEKQALVAFLKSLTGASQ